MYDAIFGAYTELFAGLSPEITIKNNGAWVGQPSSSSSLWQSTNQSYQVVPWGGLRLLDRTSLQH